MQRTHIGFVLSERDISFFLRPAARAPGVSRRAARYGIARRHAPFGCRAVFY
ncbi:hypothetical protein UA75_07005 [Actinoalloteichus sp. GBA129-24]|uniref:Uncharacterized protein n=1 Tax=Actinoalloteichus fjordicus TaxID=1612552 RepID=A0AAC9L9K7_9PSEU|nr:hypothetical protein UA74_07010 [Actinoalloteichus fjordicus]APU19420.1 hypothetical protein UA75_07005 [Actinoalloteichus sp. GBA129-24]